MNKHEIVEKFCFEFQLNSPTQFPLNFSRESMCEKSRSLYVLSSTVADISPSLLSKKRKLVVLCLFFAEVYSMPYMI